MVNNKSIKEVQDFVNICFKDYIPPTKEELKASIDEEKLSLLIMFLSGEYQRCGDYDMIKSSSAYNDALDILYNKYMLKYYDDNGGYDFYDDLVRDLENMITG